MCFVPYNQIESGMFPERRGRRGPHAAPETDAAGAGSGIPSRLSGGFGERFPFPGAASLPGGAGAGDAARCDPAERLRVPRSKLTDRQ